MTVAASDPAALWSPFTARAELLGAVVIRTASEAAAADLLREVAGTFACAASVARRFPRVAEVASPADAGTPEVATLGVFAVAETGSVAIDETREDRGQCFLAERLWLLVPQDQIVASLDTAMQRLRDVIRSGSVHPMLMSGPSRTADIERVLTIGVHGPRALVIVVVGDE